MSVALSHIKEGLAPSQFPQHCWAIKLQNAHKNAANWDDWISLVCFLCTCQLKAVKSCEFPTKIHFRWAGTVSGIWWRCKWRIIFCVALLPKHQRNVMRAVRVSSLNLLWEDPTKARISLPRCLRCNPQEKWECRKSLWQLWSKRLPVAGDIL